MWICETMFLPRQIVIRCIASCLSLYSLKEYTSAWQRFKNQQYFAASALFSFSDNVFVTKLLCFLVLYMEGSRKVHSKFQLVAKIGQSKKTIRAVVHFGCKV